MHLAHVLGAGPKTETFEEFDGLDKIFEEFFKNNDSKKRKNFNKHDNKL